MGLFESLESIFSIWLVIMVIGVPIIVIKHAINAKKLQEKTNEINKGLDLIDEMNMNSGSCISCVHRNGDHTKWASTEVIYCFKLEKNVNWIEEDFSREHPCPYFEGDPRLKTTRRN